MQRLVSTLEMGLQIEEKAVEWLARFHPQMRLEERNYRCKMGEIDLVYEESRANGNELVFVEVRCRTGGLCSGLESVDWKKRMRLRRAIQHYLLQYRGGASTIRVDVLGWDGRKWEFCRNIHL